MTSPVSERIESLDGLRGLAALTVMMTHILILFPSVWPIESMSNKTELTYALTFTPLHIFWAGYEAVLLFFVLSGFVLTRPYFQGRSFNAPLFLIKRCFRIYPAYWGSLLLAVLLMTCFSRVNLEGLSTWVNGIVWHGFTRASFWHHLTILLIKIPEESEMYNPVVWTLKFEVIFSLLCPLVLLFIKRLDWKISILILFGASCLGNFFTAFRFLRYIFMFGAGVALAKHEADLKAVYAKLSAGGRWFLLAFAFSLYTARWWWGWPEIRPRGLILAHDALITGGAVLIILFALFSKKAEIFLKYRPIHFLGKVSYSLFLYQVPVILAMVHAFYEKIPMSMILLTAFVLLLLVSELSYRWIELPGIKKGSELAKRMFHATSAPSRKML